MLLAEHVLHSSRSIKAFNLVFTSWSQALYISPTGADLSPESKTALRRVV